MSVPTDPVDPSQPKPDLFFPADSDEDDDDLPVSAPPREIAPSASPAPPPRSSPKEALFQPYDEDDDEDDIFPVAPTSSAGAGPSRSRPKPASSRSSPRPSSSAAKRSAPSSSAAQPPSSPIPSARPGFTRGYLGEFVCEGWSLSKGKGYCSPGSKVVFERPKPQTKTVASTSTEFKAGPARLVNGKIVHAKKPIGGTQMKLSAMMSKKPAPAVS